MEMKKVSYDKSNSVEVEAVYIIDNYIGADMGIGHSVVRSHLSGKHPKMKNISSDRTYYIIDGCGKFSSNGKTIEVTKGDMLVVPKDTIYEFEGKFDAILISCPAFNPNDDVIYRD